MTNKQSTAPPNVSDRAGPQPGMSQCSVTKKWFPEDEIVTLQGQLVSAEGKQILLDRLRTGEQAPGALLRPGTAARFWCIFLDLLLMGVLETIVNYAVVKSDWKPHGNIWLQYLLQLVAMALTLSLSILYFGLLHGWKGKTLGKMVGNLRVVNMDGTPISKTKGLARAAVFRFGLILMLIMTFFALLTVNKPSFGAVFNLRIVVPWVWLLLDGLVALADTRMQRSLHDRICGTRVIRENA